MWLYPGDQLSEFVAVLGTWSDGSSFILLVMWTEHGACVCICSKLLQETTAEDVNCRVHVEIS